MNRRLQRLKGRAQLQAYLNFGRLMRTIAPGQKRKVDRSVVVETWKAVADGQHNSNTDMTFWNGELVNSCRMDEYRLFGGFVTVVNHAEVEERVN